MPACSQSSFHTRTQGQVCRSYCCSLPEEYFPDDDSYGKAHTSQHIGQRRRATELGIFNNNNIPQLSWVCHEFVHEFPHGKDKDNVND